MKIEVLVSESKLEVTPIFVKVTGTKVNVPNIVIQGGIGTSSLQIPSSSLYNILGES